MAKEERALPRRVLIASKHALFARGLSSLLQKRPQADVIVVGIATSIQEAMSMLHTLHPHLLIVDYDDEHFNREEVLARFVEGGGRLRVVLLSLGESGHEAIVYDRRTMAAAQIDDWLANWSEAEQQSSASPSSSNLPGEGYVDLQSRSKAMKHFIGAAIVVILLAAATIFGLEQAKLLPSQASLQARPIDNLFAFHFRVIGFLFALIIGLMLYSIIAFRRKKGDETDAAHVTGNTPLEVLWTIVPLGLVLYASFLGARALGETLRADPRALEIRVVGSQWAWRFEYPDFGIISTELVLPVNKQAILRLSSTDVIHSFWVPEFRVKQDALPGGEAMVRELRITPTEIGQYQVRCAELCGRLHYQMMAPVRVVSQEDFQTWVDSQTTSLPTNPVERGDLLTQQFGCRACHSIDGTIVVGPSWKGIFGSQELLADGSTVLVDREYIVESIREPGAKIVAGFQNLMPANIGASLSDAQIEDIIAFIESLK